MIKKMMVETSMLSQNFGRLNDEIDLIDQSDC